VKPVLLDSGAIVALLNRSEKAHHACAGAVNEPQAPLITCEAIIAESCYLLHNLRGATHAVIENVAAGFFQIPFQLSREVDGVKPVLRKCKDRKIALADTIYRWGKNKPFHILLDLN
jgi:predicted nucleic acid-binding protein